MKRLLFALLNATGVIRLVAWLNREQVTVLCYHSVTKRSDCPHDPFKLHLHLGLFLDHLDHLQSNYQVISLGDLIRARREQTSLPPHSVVLTFDDGIRNFKTVVARVLLQRKLPATAFLVTDKTDARLNSRLQDEWILEDDDAFLSWEEVQTLARQGISFGSHSCSHPRLLGLSPEAVRKELQDSRAALMLHLEQPSFPFSYPHGQTSKAISRMAESLGYSCAFTTALGRNTSNSDLFALCRTVVASDDDIPTFAARVSGLTWWTSRLRGFLGTRESESIAPQIDLYEPLVPNKLDV